MNSPNSTPGAGRLDPAAPGRLETEALKQAFIDKLFYMQGKFPALATPHDYSLALCYAVRDRLLQRWISTAATYTEKGSRTVAYFSAEFLTGPHLENNLHNLGLDDAVRTAVEELGLDYEELVALEAEPGLGNGGLGRLAACFLDSMATMEVPSIGYGIRYEYGIFAQEIVDGWQVEKTDKWLTRGNPWELARPEWAAEVPMGGYTEHYTDSDGRDRVRWVPGKTVRGIPYDTPIVGYHNHTANTLRLWRAEAPESFDFSVFNRGDYYGAVEQKIQSENLTKVLYPNDEQIQGKELRLEQQFFFVSCSLQDMLRIADGQGITPERFHEKFVIQLNDTHPAIGVAELMRLLIDERGLGWDIAWTVTRRTFAYTNHTLLPEALERWPITMFQRLLPRHMEIIYRINSQFLQEVRGRFGEDSERVRRLSIIDEDGERHVRMANLSCVGSFAVNGVSRLHTDLLKRDVLRDFNELWPERFTNKTNGVTPRRWLMVGNPNLSSLITEAIGDAWTGDLSELRKLEPLAEDAAFRERWCAVKLRNKRVLSDYIRRTTGEALDPDTLFDVQVKRIHEYKRQHLNILHVVSCYLRIKSDRGFDPVPRTYLFGGKAAPGYHMAKLIIRLITAVGQTVNHDPEVRGRIRVVFVPNYNVSTSQRIYPASELSEQISTAGKEASGTGNMKFAINGALTVGTLDGANIELREEVGPENFFLFGMTADEIAALRRRPYRPMEFYQTDPLLKEALDLVAKGFFSGGDAELFRPLVENLLYEDPYCVLADFDAYRSVQEDVDRTYRQRDRWSRMALLNSARSGYFSSDRTIREYCEDIWHVGPVPVESLSPGAVAAALAQRPTGRGSA